MYLKVIMIIKPGQNRSFQSPVSPVFSRLKTDFRKPVLKPFHSFPPFHRQPVALTPPVVLAPTGGGGDSGGRFWRVVIVS